MADKTAFHPPLIAAFPVLAVYSANIGLFPIQDIYRPFLVAFAAGAVVWLVFAALLRSIEKSAWVASLLAAAVWLYWLPASFGDLPVGVGWFYLAAVAALGVVWVRRWRIPTELANRFGVVSILIAIVSVGGRAFPPALAKQSSAVSGAGMPDIVFFQVDGYGREDQLRRVMDFDNGAFVKELQGRDFFVAPGSNSNYCQTALSLAATLNLKSVQELIPHGTENREVISRLVDRPEAVRAFRAQGYDSIAVSTGFPGFTFDGFDLVIQEKEGMTYFEATLLKLTPIRSAGGLGSSQFAQRTRFLKQGFEELRKLARRTAKPRFIFSHILAPHPPFVFDANGNVRPSKGPFGYWDGSEYMANAGTPQSYREGYLGQLQWLNRELLKTVDAFGPDTVVIIQSDHGSKLGLDQDNLAQTDLREAFGILAAYRLPPTWKGFKFTDNLTPLGTFQSIVGKVTGLRLAPFGDKSYYSPFSKPTDFTDVTDRLR